MSILPLLPLYHAFNRAYFEGSLTFGTRPLASVRWSDGRLRKTAGYYRRVNRFGRLHKGEIVLSRPILEKLPQSATESTLCHEMIHVWIDQVLKVKEGHGEHFYKRMAFINASQDRFQISVRHNFPVPQSAPKWWAICPSCGARFSYQRIVRGAACRSCCNTHYHGRWNANCLLEYHRVEKGV